jgi:hypothetical protein
MIQNPYGIVMQMKSPALCGATRVASANRAAGAFIRSGQACHAEDATQSGPSDQDMRRLQAAIRLAAKMGARLAGG